MIDGQHWQEAQVEELDWWGDCANTYWEEHKQLTYAKYMGLEFYEDEHSPYNINIHGKYVVDIGGGPCSLLLKAKNLSRCGCEVIDPCRYPEWVRLRYDRHNIGWNPDLKGEDFLDSEEFIGSADEVWMYNVLQHTQDPESIIHNGIGALWPLEGTFRVFEWIDTPTNEAHPHSLSRRQLDDYFGRDGETVELASNGCYGTAYYGAFKY